jgi:hypothetical protein
MTTLTNAELAAAIEWAANRVSVYSQQWHSSVSQESINEKLFLDHLSELLRIQRERAAAAPGPTFDQAETQRRAAMMSLPQ